MNWEAYTDERVKRRGWTVRDDDGRPTYAVIPARARTRSGRSLKRISYRLYFRGRPVGRPFYSGRLARAFAEEYDSRDTRGRAELLRDGGEWCWQREMEWRRERWEREDVRFAERNSVPSDLPHIC